MTTPTSDSGAPGTGPVGGAAATLGQTMLVRVTGIDGPGITAGILHILSEAGAEVLDMEQVVVRNRLNLGIFVAVDEERSPLKDLLFFGWQRDIHIDFEVIENGKLESQRPRFAVIVIGRTLDARELGAVADAIASVGANIERIVRLSSYPVISYELIVLGGDLERLRSSLLQASHQHHVDIAIEREGLARRAKRLVVVDMDSTLIRDEVIDLLADEAGVADEIAALTAEAMAGDLDFETALRQRVRLLAGLPEATLHEVRDRLRFTPGARTFVRTLKRLGYRVAIVSGGFDLFADYARERLGADSAHANHLEIAGGAVTGELEGEIIDGLAKARLLEEIAAADGISLEQTVAIGDGANDLVMLSRAGLGIAFNPKPVLAAAADATVQVPYLDAILFVLGLKRDDIEAEKLSTSEIPKEWDGAEGPPEPSTDTAG
jgi:phosphoserine phosphatase